MKFSCVVQCSLLIGIIGLAGSCGRTTVSFTFGGDSSRLDETAVLADTGAGEVKVALIDLRGLIVDGPRPGIPLLQSGENPVDELVARLGKAERDRAVRAVVIRVNSPGGAVTASDTMYREIRRFREVSGKPVVISMGEVAASGGYYIALAGDEIFAQPTTITGSIGVIIPTVNFSDGLRRIGIVSRSIKSGANKDLANPLEPMRDGQYAVLQGLVDKMYARFRALVEERRAEKLAAQHAEAGSHVRSSALTIDDLTDGRVLLGEEALTHGLVDHLGDIRDAFARAKSLAGVASARLVKFHAQGDIPKSAYAMTDLAASRDSGSPQPAGQTQFNLVQLQLGSGELSSLGSGAAYYVWAMP